jgi:hypothetical protein
MECRIGVGLTGPPDVVSMAERSVAPKDGSFTIIIFGLPNQRHDRKEKDIIF